MEQARRTTWREVEHLTPEHRDWLLKLCDASMQDCKSRQHAARHIGITLEMLDEWLHFLTERTSWPPRFDSGVFQKPVKDAPPKRSLEAGWKDELLSLEESDALRADVMAWMAREHMMVEGLPYACKASGRKVMAFIRGDTCDAYVAAALREMIAGKRRTHRSWIDMSDRAGEADRMREQRERELLELERQKYGLARAGRPLSKMPV